MTAIYERELKSYAHGVAGYVFCAFLLLFAGIYTMVLNLRNGYSQFEYVLSNMTFIYLIAVPVLTMRSLAEERRSKTDQLLYALPMNMTKIVLGKYLSMVTVLAVPTVIMALYPLILGTFGTVNFKAAYGALLGFFLLGAALISVGLFLSSMTESQVVAAVGTLVVLLIEYFLSSLTGYLGTTAAASMVAFMILILIVSVITALLTKNFIVAALVFIVGEGALCVVSFLNTDLLAGSFPSIINVLGLFTRYDTFVNGIFDLTAVVFYLSIIGVFLFLTTQTMEKRRWSA